MRTAVFGILVASRIAVADPKLTPEQCKVEATALGTFLADTPHDKAPFVSQPSVDLAVRKDLTTPVPIAPVINATRAETSFQGQLANTRADLARLVKASPKKQKHVVVVLDELVAWSRVVEIVDVVRAAGLAPAFVFAVELTVTPPPRSTYDEDVAASRVYPPKPGQRSESRVRDELLEPCPALGKVLASAGGEGVDRAKVVVEGAAKALIACACAPDLPSVRSLLWNLVVVRRTARAILFDNGATEKLALPATTTWGVASKQLVPGTTYTFTVAP